MNQSLRKWAIRSILAFGTVALIIGMLVAFVMGTEKGTRWALQNAIAVAPVDIEAQGLSGSLLTDLTAQSIRYTDADRIIFIKGVELNIDWSRTSFSALTLERLIVAEFEVHSLGDAPPDPIPPDIVMPPLPIDINVATVSIAMLAFGEARIMDATASVVAVQGQRIQAGHIAATIDLLSIAVTNLATELAGNVPLDAIIEWSVVDSPWSGKADLSGDLKALIVWLQIDGPESLSATSDGGVALDAYGLREMNLYVETASANATVDGSFEWAPELALDLQLQADDIDPSTFVPIDTGAINTRLHLKASSAEDFALDVISLGGVWNGKRAISRGLISRAGDSWHCNGCMAKVGENRVDIEGSLNTGKLVGKFDLDAPYLHQLWPGLAGSLLGKGRVTGSAVLPGISGDLNGADLRFGDWQIDSLALKSGESTQEDVSVDIEISGLAKGESDYGGGNLTFSGPPSSIEVTANWQLQEYAAKARLKLDVEEDSIDGKLLSASLKEPFSGTWATSEDIHFHLSPGVMIVENGVWKNGSAEFSHKRIQVADDRVEIDATLSNGPLSALNRVLPERVRIDGTVNASLKVTQSDNLWSGNVEWSQHETSLLLGAGTNDEFRLQVPVADATVHLQDNTLKLRSTVETTPKIKMSLNATLDDLSADANVDAQLQMTGEDWEWVSLLISDIDDVKGLVTADLHASGKLSSPILSGELYWQDGDLAVPALNLPINDIDIVIAGSSDGAMTISGEAIAGEGVLTVSGRLENIASGSPSFVAEVTGDRADLLNWPGYQLTASPDLTFSGDIKGINITGKVDLDRAEIVIKELPEGAVEPSNDVRVEGRAEVRKERTKIHGDVEIELSDDIHINAFGLDTNLEGQLRFKVPEKGEPGAEGELRLIGGVFEAYGQALKIERGTMVFTGPLDNPIIDVRAVRTIETDTGIVTAGILLTGRARYLSSTIFSEPSMSEADALSYMVLGRPLEEASSADGSNLSDTAYSLGLKQAALISNQIGQTIGLDELTVAGKNQNTTELVAGKQVSKDLYVRYAYGVFTRLGKLLLRYRLSDSFVIEVGAGETQSMDLLYTIEKE